MTNDEGRGEGYKKWKKSELEILFNLLMFHLEQACQGQIIFKKLKDIF